MEMSNRQIVPAPPQEVWQALNDPNVLKECVPGCESIDKSGDNEYAVAMTARVGPVSAKFKGKMRLTELNPPTSYTLTFEGQGGAAGFAKGSAKVALTPEDSGTATAVGYTVSAQVGGKLAQVGSRLIDGAAKKLADDFFGSFAAKVGHAPDAATATTQAVSLDKAGIEAPGKGRAWVWVAVTVAVVVILYLVAR